MEKIRQIIDETPNLSDLQRQFFTTMLTMRKERILDFSLERLYNFERCMEAYTSQERTFHEERER